MWRGVAAVAVISALTGCAGALTPQQVQVFDQFNACRNAGLTVHVVDVQVNGYFTLTGRNSDVQRVRDCLSERFGYERSDPRIRAEPTEPG